MKPIIFSAEMSQAILDGRKTQTRRVLRTQPICERTVFEYGDLVEYRMVENNAQVHGWKEVARHTTRYQIYDVLYVREGWATGYRDDDICFKADVYAGCVKPHNRPEAAPVEASSLRWKSPIHMPKAIARIFLRVTGVRVERLQDISAEDVLAEGIEFVRVAPSLKYRDQYCYFEDCEYATAESFIKLWDKINDKKKGCSWEDSPWVWVYEFERIERNDKQQAEGEQRAVAARGQWRE